MNDQPEKTTAPAKQPAASLAAAYFVARFGIFLAILGVFWLFGFRGLPGALAAAIVSIPVSFFLLTSMREKVAIRLAERKQAQLSVKDEFRNAGKQAD